MLRASIDRFLTGYKKPSDQDAAFLRIYRRLYQVHYPLAKADRQRLEKLRPVLQKHAEAQGMDWLNLAALAFQESALQPNARSGSGPTGLMQITPSAAQRVGVNNIQNLDAQCAGRGQVPGDDPPQVLCQPETQRARAHGVRAGGLQHRAGAGSGHARRGPAARAESQPVVLPGRDASPWSRWEWVPVSYVNSVNKYYLAFDRERESLEPRGQKVASRK